MFPANKPWPMTSSDVYMVDGVPIQMTCSRAKCHGRFTLTSHAQQNESEKWFLNLGSPGEHQLDNMPSHMTGNSPKFAYHLFQFIHLKEQAYAQKQLANNTATQIPTCSNEFLMDFGFMSPSTDDYECPNKNTNHVVISFDGFCAYIAIVDGASCPLCASSQNQRNPHLISIGPSSLNLERQITCLQCLVLNGNVS
jgi:hypothetical protein